MECKSSVADIYELWTMLGQVRHAMYRSRKEELSKYGISPMQSTVTYVILALGDKATPTMISHWLFREIHSVSEFLKRMEKDGLVKKIKDLKRSHMYRVVLTEKGLEAHNHTKALESILDITSCLSEEERQQLRPILEKLWYKTLGNRGIIKIPPPYWPFETSTVAYSKKRLPTE